MGRALSRWLRLLAWTGALCVLGFVLAGPATAHAVVVGSSPRDGQRLSTAPAVVTVTFDEAVGLVDGDYLHVTNEAGTRVETTKVAHPRGDDTTITVRLRPHLPDQTYTISFRALSDDGHPAGGILRFVVGSGPLVAPSVVDAPNRSGVAAVFDVVRWVSWVGFALLGGAWLLVTVWPAGGGSRRARRVVSTGWGLALLGAVLEVVLQGAYAAGTSLGSALHWTAIDDTLHSHYGELHSVRLLLLAVLAALLGRVLRPRPVRWAGWLYLPALVAVAWTFSAGGHPATTNPSAVSIALDTVHLCSMAVWVGGLVMVLRAVLPAADHHADEVVELFSRVAFLAVTLLAVTGTYAAWRGVGSWHALVATDYGRLVLIKVALFLAVLWLGNLSRRLVHSHGVHSHGVDRAPETAVDATVRRERLRRSVVIEIAVAVAVLAVTAVLVARPRGFEATDSGALAPPAAANTPGSVAFDGFGLAPPRLRPVFTLTDTTGRPYPFATRTHDRTTLLFFGYTHCPDICPATMADIGVALRSLPVADQRRVTVAFVSTDVRRDTGPVIANWLANFTPNTHATFVGLRGTQAQVNAAQTAAHVQVARDGGASHSTQVLLYSPDNLGHDAFVYNANGERQQIAHDLELVLHGAV